MLPEVKPEGSGEPTVTVPKLLGNVPVVEQPQNTEQPIVQDQELLAQAEQQPQEQDNIYDIKSEDENIYDIKSSQEVVPSNPEYDIVSEEKVATLKKTPKLLPLQPVIKVNKFGMSEVPYTAGDEYSPSPDITRLNFDLNPDVQRSLGASTNDGIQKQLSVGKIPTLSSMSTEVFYDEDDKSFSKPKNQKDEFIKNVIGDKSVETPDFNTYVPEPSKEASKIKSELSRVDYGLAQEISNQTGIVSDIAKKYENEDYIFNEQVSSDIQDKRNKKKYDILVSGGYVNELVPGLPKKVETFLMSDEYLNSSSAEKQVYAKLLYKLNQKELGIPAREFYLRIAETFTPAVNRILAKNQAIENSRRLDEMKRAKLKELSDKSGFKEIDLGGGLIGAGTENWMLGIGNYGAAKDYYTNIIEADYESESGDAGGVSGFFNKAGKAVWDNREDAIPFISSALQLSNDIELYKILKKVNKPEDLSEGAKSNYEKLSDNEKIIFDAYALKAGYNEGAKPDGVMTMFSAVPSLLAFFGELGVTAKVPAITRKVLATGISKAVMKASERSAIIEGGVELLKAIDGISGKALTTTVSRATKPISYFTGAGAQTIAARGSEIAVSTVRRISETPIGIFDYNTAQQIDNMLPSEKDGLPTSLLKSFLEEAATIVTADIGHVLEAGQNRILLKLMNGMEKGGKGQRLLSYLYIQDEAEATMKLLKAQGIEINKNNLIRAMLNKAKVPATPVELLTWMSIHPRLMAVVDAVGQNEYKDGIWSTPYETIQQDMHHLSGLVVPSVLGRFMGISQMVYFKKIKYKDNFVFADLDSKIRTQSRAEFNSPLNISELMKVADPYLSSSDPIKNKLGKVLAGMIRERQDFDAGRIDGVDKDMTYSQYRDANDVSQMDMNNLINSIKSGDVDVAKIDEYIARSPDSDWREEFKFHKDLVEAHRNTPTTETLDDFVNKFKKEYIDIRNDFFSYDLMMSVPDWAEYARRINNLPMPEVYKSELRATAMELQRRQDEFKSKNTIPTDNILQPKQRGLESVSNASHIFFRNSDGTYRLSSSDMSKLDTDLEYTISKLDNNQLAIIQKIISNSNVSPELKVKFAEGVKEKLLKQIETAELIEEVGGRKNFAQMLDWMNEVAQQSPLTADEKTKMTNAIETIMHIAVFRDSSEKSIQEAFNLFNNILKNQNLFNVNEVIDFKTSLWRKVNRLMVKNLKSKELLDIVANGNKVESENAKEELEFRKNSGIIEGDATGYTKDEVTELVESLAKMNLVNQGKSFNELLRISTKTSPIYILNEALGELQNLEKITPEARYLINEVISLQPMKFLNLKGVKVSKVTDKDIETSSFYEPKSGIIHIKYTDDMSSAQMVHDISEEIRHVVHDNVTKAVSNGGVSTGKNSFVMTDAEIFEITKSDRTDVVADIARWWKAKDYDPNRFWRINEKNPHERTDDEAAEYKEVRDMLRYYEQRYGQGWKSLDFKDKDNKLGEWFNTDLLIRNFNRFKELKARERSSARAHYYSIYAHEYFARMSNDMALIDISQRLSGDKKVAGIVENIAKYISKTVKIPMVQSMLRSKVFEPIEARKIIANSMSPYDIQVLKEINEKINATANDAQLKDFERIADKIELGDKKNEGEHTLENITQQFREINQRNDPQELDNFFAKINKSLSDLGYDANVSSDLIEFLKKNINIGSAPRESEPEDKRLIRYVSNTARAVENLSFNKTSSQQWIQKILSAGGNKAEMDRYGLYDFFATNKNPTKTEILEFLGDKVMQVKDVILGGEINKEFTELNAKAENLKNKLKNFDLVDQSENDRTDTDFYSGETTEFGDRGIVANNSSLSERNTDEQNFNFLVNHLKQERRFKLERSGIESDLRGYENNINHFKLKIENLSFESVKEFERLRAQLKHSEDGLIKYKKKLDTLENSKNVVAYELLKSYKDYIDIKNEIKNIEDSGVNTNTLQTRHSSWTTFPLNNYREVLPVIDTDKKLFEHSHFSGINNQLYHMRLNDVTTESGKNLLLSEEFQKDWGKKDYYSEAGAIQHEIDNSKREIAYYRQKEDDLKNTGDYYRISKGSRTDGVSETYGDVNNNRILFQENKIKEYESKLKTAIQNDRQKESPYKTSDFVRAAIKRMIKMAVDEGKDGIAWTPAHIQVDRWNNAVRGVVDELYVKKLGKAKGVPGRQNSIEIRGMKNGSHKHSFAFFESADGIYRDNENNTINEVFGNEISKKILESNPDNPEWDIIKTDDLIVGGQGYIDIYDKTAVDVANKMLKKYGISVGKETVSTGKIEDGLSSRELEKAGKNIDVHAIIFNDQLKEDFGKSNELTIYSSGREVAPTATPEFKNINDFIDNNIEIDNKRRIFTFRGDIGLENLRYNEPEKYKLLKATRDMFESANLSNSLSTFITTGFFVEQLHGKKFYKSEIDDTKMIMNNLRILFPSGEKVGFSEIASNLTEDLDIDIKLNQLIKHPELFKSYPELKGVNVKLYKKESDGMGYHKPFEDGTHEIGINLARTSDVKEIRSTTIHEIQHIIQAIEGWWKGSNTEIYKDNLIVYNIYAHMKAGDKFVNDVVGRKENSYLRVLMQRINEGDVISPGDTKFLTQSPNFKKTYNELFKYIESKPDYKNALELYINSIGEIEARDAERRAMSDDAKFLLPATMALTLGHGYKESFGQGVYDIRADQTLPNIESAPREDYSESDKRYIVDVFNHQDRNAERLLEVSFKGNGGNYWKYKIENAGDILRELSKYKNTFVDPSYIYEKVNKIEKFIKEQREGVHEDDTYEKMSSENQDRLDLFRQAYKEQPVMSDAQEHARKLALAIIDGRMLSAQHEIDYFNKFRGDKLKDSRDLLMEANDYQGRIQMSRLEDNLSEDKIGAAPRQSYRSYNPVDVSWFHKLFEESKESVEKDRLIQAIHEIDQASIQNYGNNTSEFRRNQSEHARDLVDMWKNRMVKTALPKTSKYQRSEIAKLLTIPFRKNIADYAKDIKFVENLVENTNFRNSFEAAKREQMLARNRFMRNNKDNVPFYLSLRDLSRINLRMFEDKQSLDEYRELIGADPSKIVIDNFIERSKEMYSKFLEWKSKFNDQYKGIDDTQVKEEEPLRQQMIQDRKNLAQNIVSNYLINRGANKVAKDLIDEFTQVDIQSLSEKQLNEYEDLLGRITRNPDKVDHDILTFVNRYKAANEFYEQALEELSKEGIDIINRKSVGDNAGWLDWFRGTAPFGRLFGIGSKNKDVLGNISFHNVTTLFEIAEGMTGLKEGILRKTINRPLDKNYQRYLKAVDDVTKGLSPKGKFSIAQMHRIGIDGLLSQKPDLIVSANDLRALDDAGISIDNLAVGQKISVLDAAPEVAEAYNYLLKHGVLGRLKDSILVSFGIKPDETYSDDFMNQALNEKSLMSKTSKAQIALELKEIEEIEGKPLSEIIDDIIEGRDLLTPEERAYQDMLYKAMDDTKSGVHSDGISLRDASEVYYGIPFEEINKYYPILRYKTYLTAKNYFEPEGKDVDNTKIFRGVYDDFQMNTAFLEQRKPTVMSLNTNAWDMVRRRIDDQLFYLNHVAQQQYMKEIFRTPLFYTGKNKDTYFNTEATNQIVDLMNGVFNRGINEERAKLMKDVNANVVYTALYNARIMYVADALKSVAQLSTIPFSASKMYGSPLKKFEDIKYGVSSAVESLKEGTPEFEFLKNNAPEIFYRELSTYDFATHEASQGSGKGVFFGGLEQGVYRTNKSRARVIAEEVSPIHINFKQKDKLFGVAVSKNRSPISSEIALAPMLFFDKFAASSSFFGNYKNYLENKGIPLDLSKPNEEALFYSINSVRETQHSSNPINKTGIAYGKIAGGKSVLGDFMGMNLLAFKSFSLNERNTLMKSRQRMINAIADKDWDAARHESSAFINSFVGKVLFNYAKIYFQKKILAAAAGQILDNPQDSDEFLDSYSGYKNVLMRSIMDYWTLNSMAKYGASVGLYGIERLAKGDELTEEERFKYSGLTPDKVRDNIGSELLNGFAGSIVDDLVEEMQRSVTGEMNDKDGTYMNEAAWTLLILNSIHTIPLSAETYDLLKVMQRQNKMKGSGKGGVHKVGESNKIKNRSGKKID